MVRLSVSWGAGTPFGKGGLFGCCCVRPEVVLGVAGDQAGHASGAPLFSSRSADTLHSEIALRPHP